MGWTTPSSWWVGHFFLSCHHFEELPELQMILVEPNIVAEARRGRWKLFRTYLSRVFQVYDWHFLPISILMFGFAIYHFCRPVRALIVLIRSPTPKPSLPIADTIAFAPNKIKLFILFIYIYINPLFFWWTPTLRVSESNPKVSFTMLLIFSYHIDQFQKMSFIYVLINCHSISQWFYHTFPWFPPKKI